jgi:hypothetical protein
MVSGKRAGKAAGIAFCVDGVARSSEGSWGGGAQREVVEAFP